MASIGVIHTTVSSEVESTSNLFSEVVESSALVDGTTYYVICHGLCEGSASSAVFEWRLVDKTNGDAVLSNSTLKREPSGADTCQSYSFIGRFTAGSDGGGLAFEQKAPTAKTIRTQYLSLLLLDVSNLDSADYFYANDTTSATHTATYADRASLTVAEPESGDTYLMFGWVATDTNKVSINALMRMQVTQGVDPVRNYPEISYEGEDLSEVLNWWVCRPYTMSSSSAEFTIQTKDDDDSGDDNTYLESTIFGLRLDAFEKFDSAYTEALSTTTSTSFVELESFSLTPDSTDDVIVSACSVFDPNGTNRSSFERVQVGGTTKPNAVPDTESNARSNDSTDLLAMPYITRYDGVADTAQTIDLDVKKEVANDIGWLNYSLTAFSTTIASTAPINYSAVATQTFASGDVASASYNSGDVASETFNSGDVASEVNPS